MGVAGGGAEFNDVGEGTSEVDVAFSVGGHGGNDGSAVEFDAPQGVAGSVVLADDVAEHGVACRAVGKGG